jgi:hypothetical protein
MSAQAQRELDRATAALQKSTNTLDLGMLCALLDKLQQAITAAKSEEDTQRGMVQVERYARYTQEALDKKNVSEASRQLAQVRRAVAKIPDGSIKAEQEEGILQLEADMQVLQSKAQHEATTRQLERELKSTRDTIQRAGGSMSEDSLVPYLQKCRTTMAKLPTELQSVLVRITGLQNRMGWDFAIDGHALILRLNGVPLVADFSPLLKEVAATMQLKWDPSGSKQNFEDVFVKLDGRVVGARTHAYNRVFQRYDEGPREDAVHGVIVAFIRGPQAADATSDEIVTSMD